MNERERWIVYPLLFLALGAALRDKLFDQTTTRRIVCQELIVVDEAPIDSQRSVLARIGRDATTSAASPGGYLFVNGPLAVAGTVDAQSYKIQNLPLLPAIWRALQDSAKAFQKANSNAGTTSPSGAADQAAPATESTPETSTPEPSN